ncbi:MAG TPA: adenylate/guanylate cyclase domain-containing protein [Reyranella sp.]|nr:adenylate/guanylate cyclase domain-containing protein [Reyranella sp.]
MNWLFGREDAPRGPVVVALLVLLNALLLRAVDPIGLLRLRDLAFDTYQRLEPRVPLPDMPVRIVDIDEAALAEYGQWPWPRTRVAELVGKLAQDGAAVIAFDAVFAEPDRSSPRAIAQNLPDALRDSDARRTLDSLPDSDEVLAETIANAPVVTGFAFDVNGRSGVPRRGWGMAHNSGEKDEKSVPDLIRQFITQQVGAVRTIGVIEQAAKGNGFVTIDADSAIVRHVPMLFRLKGQRDEDLYAALVLEALRVAQDASTYLVRWSGAQGLEAFGQRTGVGGIRVGRVNIDTDAYGRMWLYDSGHKQSRFVSAKDVLKGTVAPDKIESNIVFIGTSAVGLKDLRSTPVEPSVPGVEVHAQLAEQMLTQTFLERPDYADGAEFLYLLVIGLVFILLLPRLSAARMAIVAAVFVSIGLIVPWIAFSRFHLLFDPIYPPATLAAIYISGSALAFMRAERDRREIRGAFNLYLSPDQVEAVVRNPDLLALGGEQREISVMFTDVRGFTRISEQFDPHGLTRFMNRFLTPMTDLILKHRGTIDKYMGDAIMAFWNAPLPVATHAAMACDTALAMQAQLTVLNGEWEAEAKAAGNAHIPVRMGIGINTGLASVGNFGSEQRLTYSCLGDEVNLASRIEGLCKLYGVGILIGENTRAAAPDLASLELDLAMVKGKTEPEHVYALLGDADMAGTEPYKALVVQQKQFLGLYRQGAFAEARTMIDECVIAADAAGWKQGYYEMMRTRIDALIDDSPPDWSGVYVAKEK